MAMSEPRPTACILCSRNCGILARVEDGHLRDIRGDERHPVSAGYLCQKAARLDHYQNHADRLDRPLRRRADGTFEPIDWGTAIAEIAAKLLALRREHGADALAYYGGGGQGNHLGGISASTFRELMGIRLYYSALAQEKTGDFWVNGHLFGRQDCHTTEDVERAECVLFLGTNPWQSHGIRNARAALRAIADDPARAMIVVDPRRTETARMADFHLQLRPGTDAHLLSAMLAICVREGLEDREFLARHTVGFESLRAALLDVPIGAHLEIADVDRGLVERAVRRFATARSACVRVDLGLQQSPNSTLNSYLEKLLFLLTGNLGKPGGNNFHTFFLPIVGHTGPRGRGGGPPRTAVTGMAEIAGLYPPNVLPAEIDNDHPRRTRGLVVDSANPLVSGADTAAYRRAFARLDLLVVVDVALTETARAAHYVLPASSQFEKWEATFFNLEFPANAFHLRRPLLAPRPGTLPETEIYRRLAVAVGAIPERFPILERIARWDRRRPRLGLYYLALLLTIALRPGRRRALPFVLQGSLGKALSEGAEAAATLWGASLLYARRHAEAVARAGRRGRGRELAEQLFGAILGGPSGTVLSVHRYEDTWSFLAHKDRRVRLVLPEMLDALRALGKGPPVVPADYPLVLIAGERRSYNANTIYRDPAWRKNDHDGAMRIHPDDAARLGLADGALALCESARGSLTVRLEFCPDNRPGVVSLPHGYGLEHPDAAGGRAARGPLINRLTDAAHRDPVSATPYHKFVPVRLRPSPE